MFFDIILGIIAGVIILGILLGQHVVSNSGAALQLAAVIVTNIIYETMLMFLLGYGLVEFPRTLWNHSNLDFALLQVQSKASLDFKSIGDAQLNVSLVVSDVMKTKEAVSYKFHKYICNESNQKKISYFLCFQLILLHFIDYL